MLQATGEFLITFVAGNPLRHTCEKHTLTINEWPWGNISIATGSHRSLQDMQMLLINLNRWNVPLLAKHFEVTPAKPCLVCVCVSVLKWGLFCVVLSVFSIRDLLAHLGHAVDYWYGSRTYLYEDLFGSSCPQLPHCCSLGAENLLV